MIEHSAGKTRCRQPPLIQGLISVLSAGILGLLICLRWAIVDLFLIPGITRQENTKARDDSYRRYGLALTPGGQQW